MAITAITDVCSDRLRMSPRDQSDIIMGVIGETVKPGNVVIQHTDGKWMKADAGTAAHKILRVGIVLYKQFIVQSTGAPSSITSNYTHTNSESKTVPILISGVAWAAITDPTTTLAKGTGLMISSTAGNLAIATGFGTADTRVVATLSRGVVNTDRFALVAIGAWKDREIGSNIHV